MATETHKTQTDRYGNTLGKVTKSNNPKRAGTTYFKAASQPSVHSSQPSVNRQSKPIQAKSTAPKAKLSTRVGKAVPAGRAVSAGRKIAGNVKLPHSDKRTTPALVKVANRTPVLVAELGIAFLIIGINGASNIARDGYQKAISGIMLRYTALTGVFFILFLFTSSKKGSTFAAWFGALIVLGILFDAVNGKGITDLATVIKGNPLQDSSGDQLVVSEKPEEFYDTQPDKNEQLV